MPNPFFALALGLCTRANFYPEKWGRHRFVPLYSIARAREVVVLDKPERFQQQLS
jgi:hypothetical protein